MKLTLKRTCFACPEQYDVFDERGNQVAYFRLRHGQFRVNVPDCGGDTIFVANPKGDGMFRMDEREEYLEKAKQAVINYYLERGKGEKTTKKEVS